MTVKTGAAWSGIVVTLDATGAKATPSVGPVGELYVNGVANAASVTITGSNPYKWTVTLPSLNPGDRVSMYITATVSSIATASVVAEESADTYLASDIESLVDDIGAAGAGLSGIPWNSAWDAEVQSEVADALGVYDGPTNAEMEARTIVAANYALQASVDDLEGRLTATRAGYLDNLSGGAVALEATAQSILTDTGTDIPASLTTIDDFLDTEVAAIKAKTDNLPSDPADQSAVEAAITAATSPLATAASVAGLNNLSAAQVNAEVVDVLRTDTIPDSVPADGSAPTLSQAVYLILQRLYEAAVSGTTLTVYKPDGTTALVTCTINDDTSPTAITRAS